MKSLPQILFVTVLAIAFVFLIMPWYFHINITPFKNPESLDVEMPVLLVMMLLLWLFYVITRKKVGPKP